jgi:hypothetical protein
MQIENPTGAFFPQLMQLDKHPLWATRTTVKAKATASFHDADITKCNVIDHEDDELSESEAVDGSMEACRARLPCEEVVATSVGTVFGAEVGTG